MGNKDDRSLKAGTADERINQVLERIGEYLVQDLGFDDRRNTGDKYRLDSRQDDGELVRITARPNFVHGEGRMVIEIRRSDRDGESHEFKARGLTSVHEETAVIVDRLALLIKRATGVQEDVA